MMTIDFSPYLNKGLNLIKRSTLTLFMEMINFGPKSQHKKLVRWRKSTLEMNRIDNCALIRKTYLDMGGYALQLTGLGFEDWIYGCQVSITLKDWSWNISIILLEYRVRPNSMLQKLFQDKERQKQVMHILHQRHSKVGHGGFRNR